MKPKKLNLPLSYRKLTEKKFYFYWIFWFFEKSNYKFSESELLCSTDFIRPAIQYYIETNLERDVEMCRLVNLYPELTEKNRNYKKYYRRIIVFFNSQQSQSRNSSN